ncbi:MAG: hypothetical protein WDM84_06160 [Bauldia sp.]
MSADQWQAIKAAIAAELPLEARGFDCLGRDHAGTVAGGGARLGRATDQDRRQACRCGLPRDEVAATLSAAEGEFALAPGGARRAGRARQILRRRQTWQDRFFNLESLSLGDTIDKLLPPQPPDADNN